MRAQEFITKSNAQAWIDKIYSQFQDWPYGRGDKVMVWGSGDDQQFAVFALKPVLGREDIVDVDWFQAHPQRQGVGSRAMAELQQLAQVDGIKLKLFPWDKGQVSQTALKRFYKRAGFKPVAPGATSMQWEPKLDEYINKSILKPGWKDSQTILDGQYRLEAEVKEWANKPTLFIKVYDDQATDWKGNPKPKEAGYTRFVSRGMLFKDLVASMVYVNPEYRRQGIASAMYKYVHGLGNSIKPSTAQLTPGKELWKGIKTKGGIDKLEEELLDEGIDFTNAVNSVEKLIRQNNIKFKSYEDLLKFVANRKFLQAQRNDQRFVNDVARAVLRRLHSTQLNEINDDDELSVSQQIQDYFTSRGYGYLGEGRDQIAFLSPRGTVVKVVGIGEDEREDIVKTYVGFFLRNQRNPHYPRIYNAGDFAVDGETYFVYEMEYLNPLSGEERVLYYIEELMSALPRGEHALNAFYKNTPRPPELSEEQVDGLVLATQDLEDAIGGQAPLDLRSIENLGRRKDGQIVIIDPFSL